MRKENLDVTRQIALEAAASCILRQRHVLTAE